MASLSSNPYERSNSSSETISSIDRNNPDRTIRSQIFYEILRRDKIFMLLEIDREMVN